MQHTRHVDFPVFDADMHYYEDEASFQAWKKGYPTFAQTQAQVAGDAAAGAPLFAVCAACHGAQAEGNPVLNAPKLSGQQDWYLQRQLQHFKSGALGFVSPRLAIQASIANLAKDRFEFFSLLLEYSSVSKASISSSRR